MVGRPINISSSLYNSYLVFKYLCTQAASCFVQGSLVFHGSLNERVPMSDILRKSYISTGTGQPPAQTKICLVLDSRRSDLFSIQHLFFGADYVF